MTAPNTPPANRSNVVPLRRVASGTDADREDALRCLQWMIRRIERGEVVGLCFAALESDGQYFVASCGGAHRNAQTASAMASSLWYQTMKQVFGDA